jgi:hypothetical protein
MKKIILSAILLFFVGCPAYGQDEIISDPIWPGAEQAGLSRTDAAQLLRTMTEAGFTERQIQQIQDHLQKAYGQGLPVDPLSNKIYEGVAKNVPPDRIGLALGRVAGRYATGKTLAGQIGLNTQQTNNLSTQLASCLAAGLTPEDAQQIISQLQERSQERLQSPFFDLAQESLLTARNLTRMGVSSTTTASMVGQAIARGYSTDDIRTMRQSFSRQAGGYQAEKVAKSYCTGINQGLGASELSSQAQDGSGALSAKGRGDMDRSGDGNSEGQGNGNGGEAGGESGGNSDAGGGSEGGGSEGGGSGGGGSGGGGSGSGGSGSGRR